MKINKKEIIRQEGIIEKNIKHFSKCIQKCKSDKIFNRNWNIKDFEKQLLFWKSMRKYIKLYKKTYGKSNNR